MVVLPTETCRDYFLLPVSLAPRPDQPADRTLWFLYDIGAAINVVDPDSVARVSNSALTEGQRAVFSDLSVGPAQIPSLRALVEDLDHLSVAIGRPLDGILAFDAFGDALVELDYQSGTVRLGDGRLPRPDGEAVLRTRGPDLRPWLVVDFPEGPRKMLLDSGAARSALVVRGLDDIETVTPPRPTNAVLGLRDLEIRSAARAIGAVHLGALVLDQPILQSTDDTQLVGGAVMKHFTWTFDPRRDRVRVIPTAPGEAVRLSSLVSHGMVLAPQASQLRVAGVLDDTPAAAAGILVGDIITHLQGAPVATRGCGGEQGAVRVTLLRDGVENEVTVVPAALVE